MRIESIFGTAISGKLGITKYRLSEGTQEELTPQKLMSKTKDVLQRRPFVMSGLDQRVKFVNGTKLMAVLIGDSDNTKGAKWVQAWLDQRKAQLNYVRHMAGMNWYSQGNVYFEPIYRKGDKANEMFLDNMSIVPDSSRILYNTAADKTNVNFWLHSVDDEITRVVKDGETIATATYQPYKTSPSSNFFNTTIKAFTMPKNKLFHMKMPYTLDGYYGFSFLMSTVDDEEAINKIIRNLTIISSNKAVGKKIISLQGGKGNQVSADDIDELENKLDLDAGENIIINKDFKVEDLASQGTYDTMMPEIDYLTKDIISGLSPSYMTPWNQSMSLANAQQARLPFIMSNESEKNILENFWTAMLIPLLAVEAKSKGVEIKDVEITFGETQYYSLEERKDFYEGLYEHNMITFNQYLKHLDMPTVENGDIYLRERDSQLDKAFGPKDNFDQFAESAMPGMPTLKEAIEKEEFYDPEFEDEDNDMSKQTKKELNTSADDIDSLLDKHLG